MDAIPGVVSVVDLTVPFPGLYIGMCRELCGAFHSFMPINVEATSPALFFERLGLWSQKRGLTLVGVVLNLLGLGLFFFSRDPSLLWRGLVLCTVSFVVL